MPPLEPAGNAPARTPTPNGATQGTVSGAVAGAVAHEVLPNVSQGALNTITGTIRVRVRIRVDRAGNVTEASLESPGPSPYFARLALAAAKGWKFAAEPQTPPADSRLTFEIRRDGTRALSTEIR